MIPGLQIALAVFLWVLSAAVVLFGAYFGWANYHAHRAYLAKKKEMDQKSEDFDKRFEETRNEINRGIRRTSGRIV